MKTDALFKIPYILGSASTGDSMGGGTRVTKTDMIRWMMQFPDYRTLPLVYGGHRINPG